MNPADLPVDRFCNLIWTWYMERLDETAWAQFEAQVTSPPPGAAAPASTDNGFLRFQQAFTREVESA